MKTAFSKSKMIAAIVNKLKGKLDEVHGTTIASIPFGEYIVDFKRSIVQGADRYKTPAAFEPVIFQADMHKTPYWQPIGIYDKDGSREDTLLVFDTVYCVENRDLVALWKDLQGRTWKHAHEIVGEIEIGMACLDGCIFSEYIQTNTAAEIAGKIEEVIEEVRTRCLSAEGGRAAATYYWTRAAKSGVTSEVRDLLLAKGVTEYVWA